MACKDGAVDADSNAVACAPAIIALAKEGGGSKGAAMDSEATVEERKQQQHQQHQPPLHQQCVLVPMDGCKDNHCAMSNGAGRPPFEIQRFSMLDPDDDCEELDGGSMANAEQAVGECLLGEVHPRLSFMFEHNDLINNRIAALASAIRTGALTQQMGRRSMTATEMNSTDGNCSSCSSSTSSCTSPCQGARELVHVGLVDSQQAAGAKRNSTEPQAEHEKCFERRCRMLEHMLQEAQLENASLREQLARASVSSAGKTTKQTIEGVQLHWPAAERKLSTSAVGPLQDSREPRLQPPEEAVSTAQVPPLGAVRRRRPTRRRLARIRAPTDEKLEECETIITRLVDEIEVLTTAKDELQPPRPSTFFAVEDLKNAISDFFGGLGAVEDEPVASSNRLQTVQQMQMAAKKLQANKPRRTRFREEGSRSVQQSSN